jgi:hypothetical protein
MPSGSRTQGIETQHRREKDSMNLDALREALVDLHARWHHDIEIARSRVDTIMVLIERHLVPEPGFILDCDTEVVFIPLIPVEDDETQEDLEESEQA